MSVVYTAQESPVFLVVGARAIFLIKLATKIFIIAHTSERTGVLQVKKDRTLELLWEKCEISMVKVGGHFTSLW
jgi:hypothetical protein